MLTFSFNNFIYFRRVTKRPVKKVDAEDAAMYACIHKKLKEEKLYVYEAIILCNS